MSFLGRGIDAKINGLSGDGTTIIGQYLNSSDQKEAFYWSALDGIVSLGFLPGDTNSEAKGVSEDGSVIVGGAKVPGGKEAFIWALVDDMVSIGDIVGGTVGGTLDSEARDTSADGSVVVRKAYSDLEKEAFIWDPVFGMRVLENLPGGKYEAEDLPIALVDSIQFEQVLVNLVRSGRGALTGAGSHGGLQIRTSNSAERRIPITVFDMGVGMAAEIRSYTDPNRALFEIMSQNAELIILDYHLGEMTCMFSNYLR